MKCRRKLQSNNQDSQDWVSLNFVEILYFLFADAADRRRRHFAGAAAAGKKHPARRRPLIKTGAGY